MISTMQEVQLTVGAILRHGETVHAGSEVVTLEAEGVRRARFGEVARRARRLASALAGLGIQPGDRVGTFMWNTQEHLEAYLAVPMLGAVLHTLNIRLHPEEVAWLVNHARDRVLLVDASLLPVLEQARPLFEAVEHIFVVGDEYQRLLRHGDARFEGPALDEKQAAAMCYTSGTTGRPKGVVYSHRSTWLHAMTLCSGSALGIAERDRVLPIVPMFHANAWGLPYAAWMMGADLLLPGRFANAAGLARLFSDERATVAAAVPTVYRDLLQYGESHPLELGDLRLALCGGAAVSRSLIEAFAERHGVTLLQAWGMTETSPLAAIAHPPKDRRGAETIAYQTRAGRVVCGVEARIIDDHGWPQPWDGRSEGEIEVRGPWVTASYYGDPAPEKFHEGWLRTGDVGSLDAQGFLGITDRSKDVIKSGGEWISSVALENALMAHPSLREAAVIAVADDRWTERPLACVVKRPGAEVSGRELAAHLEGQVARWWVPERWAFLDEVPKTSVGKFDKKRLRALEADGKLRIERID